MCNTYRSNSFKQSEATQLEMVKSSKFGGGIGAPSRDESLKQAGELHLKTGNLRRYCELLVSLGQWVQALAVAPGVSLEYWKDLTEQ